MNHADYMIRALYLAEKGIHKVSPNPAVGAVIVKNNRIIGEGFHKGPGYAHAEIEAIENTTRKIEGSILYTTLEPCVRTYKGKNQPPCVDRIIREKISLVVISMVDPNSYVNGRGITKLKSAGINVITGILEEKTRILNEVYIKNIIKKTPFIHLKVAQTIDGRIATSGGNSKWITDNKAREEVHSIRSRYDAILIGSSTASIDNPLLTVRNKLNKTPFKIVLDSNLKINPKSKLLNNNNPEKTILITSDKTSIEKINKLSEKKVKIVKIALNNSGFIDLNKLLKHLWKIGICSVLVEGGSEIFTSFIKEVLYDKITVFIAPLICGYGKNSVNNMDTKKMSDSIRLNNVLYKQINDQIVMTGYRSF